MRRSTVYELTDGRPRARPRAALARAWGAQTLGPPYPSDCWSMYAVHARFRPDAAVDGVYEIRFDDGEVISLDVRDGELVTAKGSTLSRRSSSSSPRRRCTR